MSAQYLELEDLTKEQYDYFKKHIYNGVGSREFPINPHDLIFKKAAEKHDFYYWRGGDDSYRVLADKEYLKDSLIAVKLQPKWKQPFYHSVAYVYYGFLVALGRFAFEYSDEPCKTWEQLLKRFQDYQNKNNKKQSTRKLLLSKLRR